MDKSHRKAAQAAWRERRPRPGIYALTARSGAAWVGRASNLDTIANRVLFVLRQGTSPHRDMQAAWNEEGGAGLAFSLLEELDEEDALGLSRERVLKERHEHWIAHLGAKRI
ncbi:GIY-YIG nuclease family protein [Novosphingobium profundi]|uniref:GIY-YIG nuclease family protein n=1 Tax=Novosphingobium profundi TaxID=1774954 RepID=UPI001BD93B92|nr:GIY-YIG nuclease family protein [Novosphingobium profundi]